jgi:hypothetical protein
MRVKSEQDKVDRLVFQMEEGFRRLNNYVIGSRPFLDEQNKIRACNMEYYNMTGQYYYRKVKGLIK